MQWINSSLDYSLTYTYDLIGQAKTETYNNVTINTPAAGYHEFIENGVTYSLPVVDSKTLIGPGNRILQDSEWFYHYDNEGNLIYKTKRSDQPISWEWKYQYDHANRLTRVTGGDRTSGLPSTFTPKAVIAYDYDAEGRMVRRHESSAGYSYPYPLQGEFPQENQEHLSRTPANNGTTRFLYDGANVWAEAAPDGKL